MIVFACAEFGKKIVLVVRNSEPRNRGESTWHTRVGGGNSGLFPGLPLKENICAL